LASLFIAKKVIDDLFLLVVANENRDLSRGTFHYFITYNKKKNILIQ
jgi:hypothetical protein